MPSQTFTVVGAGDNFIIHSFGGKAQEDVEGTAQLFELHKISFLTNFFKMKIDTGKDAVNLFVQISEGRTDDLRNPVFTKTEDQEKLKNNEVFLEILKDLVKSVEQCKDKEIVHGDIRPGSFMMLHDQDGPISIPKLINFSYSVHLKNTSRVFPSTDIQEDDPAYENIDLVVSQKYKQEYRLPISDINLVDKLKPDSQINSQVKTEHVFALLKNSLNDYYALAVTVAKLVEINQEFLDVDKNESLQEMLGLFDELRKNGEYNANKGSNEPKDDEKDQKDANVMALESNGSEIGVKEFIKNQFDKMTGIVEELEAKASEKEDTLAIKDAKTEEILKDKKLNLEQIDDELGMIAMDDFEDPDDMSSGDKSEKLDDSQMEDIKFLEGSTLKAKWSLKLII